MGLAFRVGKEGTAVISRMAGLWVLTVNARVAAGLSWPWLERWSTRNV